MTVAPSSGPVGTVVTVTSGPGWVAGSVAHLSFASSPVKDVAIGADGMVNTTFTVPSKGAAQWPVRLTDDTELLGVNGYFTITPMWTGPMGSGSKPAAPAVSTVGPLDPTAPANPDPGGASTTRRSRSGLGSPSNAPATGQISAHDGRFWLGSQPVVLRGLQVAPIPSSSTAPLTLADYATMSSWHFNFVRFIVHWQLFETGPPTQNPDGSWTHNYSADWMTTLKNEITWASANGLYVLLENAESEEYPPWLLQATYNSHHINYTDQNQFDTDYWTDTLAKQFTQDFLTWMASQVKSVTGIAGYEVVDEPDPGYLPLTHLTTQELMDQQLLFAQSVRAVDPSRVIFFMTRSVMGDGLINADLSGWKTLGNVALDVHDYWGARADYPWVMDPANAGYGEGPGAFIDFTLNAPAPPYLGTTLTQERFVNTVLGVLGTPGTPGAIPLCMCESGVNVNNPNVWAFHGTTTSAFNQLGVSWSQEAYNTDMGVLVAPGSYQPWLSILQDAASYGTSGDVTAPALSSLVMQDTNRNGKVDQVTAKFTEQLAPYTAGNAPWTLTGGPSGATLKSVSVTGSTAILTLNEGSGAQDTTVGNFKVALSATAGGIADAAGNQSSFFALAPADGAAPALTSLVMTDKNGNGKVDQVTATFSETLAPSYAGTAAWALANVPSKGTASQVKTSGNQALVNLAEGSGQAETGTATSTGTFTVALNAMSGGVGDTAGNLSTFAATVPADAASPVVVSVTSSNGNGKMQSGDRLDITFSEAMGSIPSTTSISIISPGEAPTQGQDSLSISGLVEGSIKLGSKYYLLGIGTATFANSTLSFVSGSGNATIRATVSGSCTGLCTGLSGGQGQVQYLPASTLKDPSSNPVVLPYTTSATFVLF